ncbi:Ig domain-containing protein, partial [Blastococcus sp. SYSU DS0616]
PFTWSVIDGALPAGLTLAAGTGRIEGTPTAFGTSSFTVEAVDRRGTKATAVLELSVTSARLPVQVTSTSLTAAEQGTPYAASLTATGGVEPFTWSVIDGALPAGLTLAAGTGRIEGTPTAFGTSSFTVEAVDQRGTKATAVLELPVREARSILEHCGDLSSSATWAGGAVHRLTCPVTVPAGVELRIEAGATVLFDGGLNVEGALVVAGTAAAPVTLGSPDHGPRGQGMASIYLPVAASSLSMQHAVVIGSIAQGRDRSAISEPVVITDTIVNGHVKLDSNAGSVVLQRLTVGPTDYTYDSSGLSVDMAGGGTITITNNILTDTRTGIVVKAPQVSSPVVRDNTVTRASGLAVHVAADELSAEHLSGNTATGGTQPRLGLSGRLLGATSTADFQIPLTVLGTLTVPAGVELRIEAGATVLFDGGLNVEGALVVAGTAAAPVTLGSPDHGPRGQGMASIYLPVAASSLSMQHAVVIGSIAQGRDRSAISEPVVITDTIVNGHVKLDSNAGSVVLQRLTVGPTDYTYDSSGLSVDMAGGGTITITNNILTDTRTGILVKAEVASVSVLENQVQIEDPGFEPHDSSPLRGVGVAVVTNGDGPMPTVRDNAVRNAPGEAYVVTAQHLDLASVGGNVSVGSGEDAMLLGGTLRADATFPAENGLDYGVIGQSWSGPFGFLAVGSGVTLSIHEGADIPIGSRSGCGYGCFDPQLSHIYVEPGGFLRAGGSSSDPVTLRISKVDGPGQTWGGIYVEGSAVFAHSVVGDVHPSRAALQAERGQLIFRGEVKSPVDLTEEQQSAWVAVESCDPPGMEGIDAEDPSLPACFVDVSGVDWGDGRGPGPLGTGPTVCGLAIVGPWVGGSNEAVQTSALDCSSPADPWEAVAAELQNLCAQLGDDTACVTVDGYLGCTDTITRAAIELHPQALDILMVQEGEDYVAAFAASVQSLYVEGMASSSAKDLLQVSQGVADAAGAYLTLTSAAETCKAQFGY